MSQQWDTSHLVITHKSEFIHLNGVVLFVVLSIRFVASFFAVVTLICGVVLFACCKSDGLRFLCVEVLLFESFHIKYIECYTFHN